MATTRPATASRSAATTATQPALKDMFDEARFQRIAGDVAAVWPDFDVGLFLRLGSQNLAQLTLMQRLRRVTQALHQTLPPDYLEALDILYALAQRTDTGFVSLFLPDFVGQYGQENFEASMRALTVFTKLGSAEFAVREFLRTDLNRTLEVMTLWSLDADARVRRLASEGARPRLPWAVRLRAIIDQPELTLPILANLSADPSLSVRKSVANHLNDISKDHPAWVLDVLQRWPQDNPHTTWIARRAMRTLVKAGHPQALLQHGASGDAAVSVTRFELTPDRLSLGDLLTLSVALQSQSGEPLQLVVDYRIHYVKKAGSTSAKVFKFKELALAPYGQTQLVRRQRIKDFSTRTHYAGEHRVELLVNGRCLAHSRFELCD